MREAENAVKGPLLLNDFVEHFVRFGHRSVVLGAEGSRPFVVAVVRAFVDAFDAWARGRVELAPDVVEGGAVVSLEFLGERTWMLSC